MLEEASQGLYATWLGYLNIAFSALSLMVALVALFWRDDRLEKWTFPGLLAVAVTTMMATIVALAIYAIFRSGTQIYVQLFLAATLFTVALAVAGWRQLDGEILWLPEKRLLYLLGLASCTALAVTLVWMG